MNDERLLSTMEAANFLGLDTGTLKRWRTRGGPSTLPYVKISANRARYSLEALKTFVAERTRKHTADPGPSAPESLPTPRRRSTADPGAAGRVA